MTTKNTEQSSHWPTDDRAFLANPTGGSRSVPGVQDQTPISAVSIATQATELASKANSLANDIASTHSDALAQDLAVRVQTEVKKSPQHQLERLGELGFAWREVARMTNVSVPALRKWRQGEGVTGDNRRKLATLVAGVNAIASQYSVEDIQSWFETPISDNAPITPTDLWSAGLYNLVLRYASDQVSSETVLDHFEPDWREKWRSEFNAFRGEDGSISIAHEG